LVLPFGTSFWHFLLAIYLPTHGTGNILNSLPCVPKYVVVCGLSGRKEISVSQEKKEFDGLTIQFVPNFSSEFDKRFDAPHFVIDGHVHVDMGVVNTTSDGMWLFTSWAYNFHNPQRIIGRLSFLGPTGNIIWASGTTALLLPTAKNTFFSMGSPGDHPDPAVKAIWSNIRGVSGYFALLDE
jgi:hypothetical protein